MLFESQYFPDPRGAGRDPFPLSSKVPLDLLVTVGVFASRWVLQAGSEVSQRPALLLLKPEQDYFHFHFPNSCSGSKDTKQSVIPKALSSAGHWIGSCQALAAVGASALMFSVCGHGDPIWVLSSCGHGDPIWVLSSLSC